MSTLEMTYQYQPRDPSRRYKGLVIVVALHALLGYALVSGLARKGLDIIKKPLEAAVIQEVIIPPPPPPPPKEVRPADPQSPKVETPTFMPPPDTPPPSVSANAPVIQSTSAPPPTPAVITPPPPPPPDNSKAIAASMENEYALMVRTMLNSTKRYPTGRAASQQRPEGKVKVWFTLARGGALLDSGVLESSNSNLLDDAALAAVRRGTYPPFPANTWVGQEQHKFSAEIEFKPPSQ